METDNRQPAEEPTKKKRMMKVSTILMISLIGVLTIYYFVARSIMAPPEAPSKGDSLDSATVKKTDTVSLVPDLDSVFDVRYLMGKFIPSKEPGFVLVDLKHGSKEGQYLRKETYEAFIKMYDAAMKDGVKLIIVSATRNFDSQKGIWEAKWNGSRLVNGKNLATSISDPVERARTILSYSSMPGTSRHHWGTEIDLNSVSPAYFASGTGLKLYQWLDTNAVKYGFCRPYCAIGEGRSSGYEEEKWHWSYMPLSQQCLKAYGEKVRYTDITGFKGSETAETLGVIKNYVQAINANCK